jgi:hypothetical protein
LAIHLASLGHAAIDNAQLGEARIDAVDVNSAATFLGAHCHAR